MQFVFRITLLVFAICLVVLSIHLMNLRQLPSEAYWISFKTVAGDGSSVYVMFPDGSNQRFLGRLDHVANSRILEWTADGQSLFFYRFSEQAVFRVQPGSQQLEKIPTGDTCPGYVAISPDGEWLIVPVERNLYRLNMDRTQAEVIYPMGPYCSYPVVSPDGTWLAMTTSQGGRQIIVRLTLDGQNFKVLAPPPDHHQRPIWSPDGNWLGYIAYTFDNNEQIMGVYRMRADGSDKLMLSVGMDSAYFEGWSPDSEWILFTGHDTIPGYSSEIFKIRRDGTDLQQLTFVETHGQRTVTPEWTPDGEWIIFSGELSSPQQVHRIKPDGTHYEQLTDLPYHATNGPVSPLVDLKWHTGRLILLVVLLAGSSAALRRKV
jgi:Tol biopolymer transport system component